MMAKIYTYKPRCRLHIPDYAPDEKGGEKGIRCKSVTLGRRCKRELVSQYVTVIVDDGKARWTRTIRKSEDLPWFHSYSERFVRINPHGKLFLCGFFYACCSTGISHYLTCKAHFPGITRLRDGMEYSNENTIRTCQGW